VDRITAWTVLAETGVDMSVFGDAAHLASWAGLCPGNRESGGKRISGKTRKGNRYLRRVLCQSAWAASHTKDTHLAGLFRNVRGRRGEQKAIMAVAHQLLVIMFHIIRDGSVYQELGANHYEQRNKPKVTRRLIERLEKLGYSVTLQAKEPLPAVADPVEVAAPAHPAVLKVPADRVLTEASAPVRRKRGRPCKCAERGIACKHGRVSTNEIQAAGITARPAGTNNVST
jgi:hypothetical protein